MTPEPGLFSFNNPMGACPRCQGFGNTIDYDMDLVIPNPACRSMKARWIPGPSRNMPGFGMRFKKVLARQGALERAVRRSAAEEQAMRR